MRKSGDKNKAPDKSIFQDLKENKIKAKEAKDLLTPKKANEGWVWVCMGKTSKQVAPENVEKNIALGWKRKTVKND